MGHAVCVRRRTVLGGRRHRADQHAQEPIHRHPAVYVFALNLWHQSVSDDNSCTYCFTVVGVGFGLYQGLGRVLAILILIVTGTKRVKYWDHFLGRDRDWTSWEGQSAPSPPARGLEKRCELSEQGFSVKVKVKVVNSCSASSCIHTSNALFVTNQSRRSHSRRVQPANTGWCTGRPGSPVSCTKVPTFRNPYNGLLLI